MKKGKGEKDMAVDKPVYAKDVGEWEDRIIGAGKEEPHMLLANEYNWRTHPRFQRDLVEESLGKIGWVQDVIVNVRESEEWGENDRGVHTVIDGHLRVFLAINAQQKEIPVKYVNLSPDEERLALLILDTSTQLANVDSEVLREVMMRTTIDIEESPATARMLENMKQEHKLFDLIPPLDLEDGVEGRDRGDIYICPKCGFSFEA